MSPTHANKRGARYRYYVSQAVLQGKPPPPGLVSRVPAAEIEALAVAALRNHLNARGGGERLPDNDRDLLERHLERVTLTPDHLELRLRELVHHRPDQSGARGTAGCGIGRRLAHHDRGDGCGAAEEAESGDAGRPRRWHGRHGLLTA